MRTLCNTKAIPMLFILSLLLFPAVSFAEFVGSFSRIEGRVDLLRAGTTTVVPARRGDGVSTGDIIRTKSDGRAEILFKDDTTVAVAPETRLKINEYTFNPDKSRNKGFLSLLRGKLRAAVSKVKAGLIPVSIGASTFSINTPTAVAGVRGTVLFVFYERGITGVVFKEGNGFVYNQNMPDKIVNVSEGQATFILRDDAPPLPPRPATDAEMSQHIMDTTIKETDTPPTDNGDTAAMQTETTHVDIADTMTTLLQTAGGDVSGDNAPKTADTGVDPGPPPPVLPITETDTGTFPPLITITSSPQAITNSSSGSFTITANEPVTFTYSMDSWVAVSTLTTSDTIILNRLPEGSHTLTITATDAAGNTSTTTYTWTTDYTAPIATLTPSASPESGGLATINIGLSSNESSKYLYRLDGGSLTSTEATLNLSGISEGNHTVVIQTTDQAGNTVTDSVSFDLSRYGFAGKVSDTSGGISGSVTSGEVAGISNQNWGGWINPLTGTYTSMPQSLTLNAGGRSTDAATSNNGGYWLEIINGTSGASSLSGTSNLKYLSYDRLGTGTGTFTGSYSADTWSATDSGTYTETPLAWSGDVTPDNNSAGLYSVDTANGWLDIGGNSTGIMGGIASPWSGTTAVNYMGTYTGGANGPLYLWTPEIFSYNVNNATNTTFDNGAYKGFIGGVWNADGTIDANVYSLYIDPAGNAGILKGDVTGAYYPALNMFEADGTWTPTALTTGLNPATDTVNVVSTNYGYSISSYGDFIGSGSITAAGNGMLTATDWRYSISGQDWGIYKSIIGGGYAGPASDLACATAGSCDTWSLSTFVNLSSTIYGTMTDGSKWSNGVLAGTTYGYGADIANTPMTWISVGETIGTFDPAAYTWQAAQTGAWLDTTKFLTMAGKIGAAPDTATLAELNIPFVEVGRADLTGTNTDWTINMNNTIFFAYSDGTAPRIWATGDVTGSYTCSTCGPTPTLTGNGLSAQLNMQTWDTANNKWTAAVGGYGLYSGTGSMNGSPVVFGGAAAGTIDTTNSTFSGTGSGVAK